MNKLKTNQFLKSLILLVSIFFLASCASLTKPYVDESVDIPDIPPEEQFVVYENGQVLDTYTNLEWYSGDVTKLEESGTRYWINRLNEKDPGWRLPTRNELYAMNKNGRKYLKSLRLTRDLFWISGYRVYDVISNIDTDPDLSWFRYRMYMGSISSDDDDGGRQEVDAHILLVRNRING